jgi:hypothetical protein
MMEDPFVEVVVAVGGSRSFVVAEAEVGSPWVGAGSLLVGVVGIGELGQSLLGRCGRP